MAGRRVSLANAAQVPLPSSPGIHSPRERSTPSYQRSSPAPLRKCSSSTSLDQRSPSPSLLRKASTTSLRDGKALPSPTNTLRRSSSSHYLSSPLVPAMTANSIAADFFQSDLANHRNPGSAPKTVVLLQDDCYGHRFAKPSSKRAAEQALEYTFERPERIEAATMGVSGAYVLLGDRHADGPNAPHPKKAPAEKHPFRIQKTTRSLSLQSPFVTAVHGTKWMGELSQMCGLVAEKLPLGKELERIKSTGPKTVPKEELHTGDLYLCSESLAAFEGALGGVCDAVDAVFAGSPDMGEPCRAFVAIRPPGHHCSAAMPSGFCWVNNVHVGIEYAARTHGLTHAAIIDFDLHHGDGSQAIAWARNNKALEAMMPSESARNQDMRPRNYAENFPIGYYSLHDIDSYPCESHNPVAVANASLCIDNHHGQSIWNVHLENWNTEDEFWATYEQKYQILIEKMRNFLRFHTEEINGQQAEHFAQTPKKNAPKVRASPRSKAAIFISAGFDASEHEIPLMQRHGKNVCTEFYARLTKDIVALAAEEGTSVDGRIVSVLEGGYSNKALVSGVLSHLSGLCDDRDDAPTTQNPQRFGPLGIELENHFGKMQIKEEGHMAGSSVIQACNYSKDWWTHTNLVAMEQLLPPRIEVFDAGHNTNRRASGFSDPTRASAAKIVDPSKIHRSPSWSAKGRTMPSSPSRPATPPPPEVDWVTAVHELSKILVPTERQTKSFTSEDLTESTRPKKARHTTIGLPSTEDSMVASGRQMRDRRAKNTGDASSVGSDSRAGSVAPAEQQVKSRNVSRSDRRKTIGDLPNPSTETPAKQTRRRSSVASAASLLGTSPLGQASHSRQTSVSAPSDTGLQVKKSRGAPPATTGRSTATTGRSTAVKASNPPAVPRIPSGYRNQAIVQQPVPNWAQSAADNMLDELTSGLKRIKINVPTDEEYAARQAKKATIPKSTVPKAAPPKPASTKTTAVRKTAPKPKKKTPVVGPQPRPAPSSSLKRVSPTIGSPPEPAIAVSKPVGTLNAASTSAVSTSPDGNSARPSSPIKNPSAPGLQFHHELPMSSHMVAPFNVGTQRLTWQLPNQDVPEAPTPKPEVALKPFPATEDSNRGVTPSMNQESRPSGNEEGSTAVVNEVAPSDGKKMLPQWSATGHIPFALVKEQEVSPKTTEHSEAPESRFE